MGQKNNPLIQPFGHYLLNTIVQGTTGNRRTIEWAMGVPHRGPKQTGIIRNLCGRSHRYDADPPADACSIARTGERPSTKSTSGRFTFSRTCRALVDKLSTYFRCPSAANKSKTKEDLPDPLTSNPNQFPTGKINGYTLKIIFAGTLDSNG